jgi:hypothetical protein
MHRSNVIKSVAGLLVAAAALLWAGHVVTPEPSTVQGLARDRAYAASVQHGEREESGVRMAGALGRALDGEARIAAERARLAHVFFLAGGVVMVCAIGTLLLPDGSAARRHTSDA